VYKIHHSRNAEQCENEESNDRFPEVRVSEKMVVTSLLRASGNRMSSRGASMAIRMHASLIRFSHPNRRL